MPALPDNPKMIRLQFIGSQGSRTNIINRVYYQYTGNAPLVTDLQIFATGAHTEYTNHVLPNVNISYYLQSVKAVDLSTTTSPEYEFVLAKGGGETGEVLPAGSAVLISFLINRRYRGGHPRWYQSGISEANVDTNATVLGSYRNILKESFDAFLNAIPTHPWTGAGQIAHYSASYYSGFTNIIVTDKRAKVEAKPRPTPVNDRVVGTAVQAQIASQRRRNLAA